MHSSKLTIPMSKQISIAQNKNYIVFHKYSELQPSYFSEYGKACSYLTSTRMTKKNLMQKAHDTTEKKHTQSVLSTILQLSR